MAEGSARAARRRAEARARRRRRGHHARGGPGAAWRARCPTDRAQRSAAVGETLAAIDQAIAGLPAAAQKELAELFALLALPPVRLALARVGAPWPQASAADVRAFLDRFRDSGFTLLRAAYGAMHELTFAAWYGNPRAWPAIGYPGPPPLA